jgi:hypothetical protein
VKKLLGVALVLLLLVNPGCARAEDFIKPTRLSLLQTMFRFGALDINNDVVVDDYARIAECDLYAAFHNDDFRWQKIRAGLRAKIRDDVVTYPTSYYVYGTVHLDRYDFDNKLFKLSNENRISGVNSFKLGSSYDRSCDATIKMLPHNYIAVLESQLNLPGFIMDEADANALLTRMNNVKNTDRLIMARFNLRVVFIDKAPLDFTKMDLWYTRDGWVGKVQDILMDSRLDSVEFYEDPDMTKRIYVYHPN